MNSTNHVQHSPSTRSLYSNTLKKSENAKKLWGKWVSKFGSVIYPTSASHRVLCTDSIHAKLVFTTGSMQTPASESIRSLPPRNIVNKSNPQQKRQGSEKLPPHPYKTADDAYRAMMRGLENRVLMGNGPKREVGRNGSRVCQLRLLRSAVHSGIISSLSSNFPPWQRSRISMAVATMARMMSPQISLFLCLENLGLERQWLLKLFSIISPC